MKIFKKKNPEFDFFFILGSALLKQLKFWADGKNLLSEISFLIFCRPEITLSIEYLPEKFILINTTFVASSSTEVL